MKTRFPLLLCALCASVVFLSAAGCASTSSAHSNATAGEDVPYRKARHPVRGWPFLDVTRSEDLRTTTTEVLWPAAQYVDGPEQRAFKLRPIFFWSRHGEVSSLYLLPLLWWWAEPNEAGFHFWPFFGRVTHGDGAEASTETSIAWPLLVHQTRPGRPGWVLSAPWPINDFRTRGPGQGYMLRLGRVPPLITLLDVGTTGRTRWALIKFFNTHVLSVWRGEWVRGRGETVLFPFYWHTDLPGYYRFHVWPAVGYTRDGKERAWSFAWPLLEYKRSGKDRAVRVLGPLAGFGREDNKRWAAILPVFWWERWPTRGRTVVFPVWWDIWSAGSRFLAIAPLYLDKRDGKSRTRAFTPLAWTWERPTSHGALVFPFLYHQADPEGRTTVVLPLYFDRTRGDATDRVVFPLWWRRQQGHDRLEAFTPLVWRWSGEDGSGFLALPLGGRLVGQLAGAEGTTDFLLPLYYSSRSTAAETTVWFPFYGKLRRGQAQLSAWTPLVWIGRGPERKGWGVFPIYADVRSATGRVTAVTPLYWRTEGPDGGSRVLLPVYWHSHGSEGATTVVFPFWWDLKGSDSRTSVLAPFWVRRSRADGYRQDWVLGPAFTRTDDPSAKQRSYGLLWPLGAYETDANTNLSHVRALPFLWWTRSPERNVTHVPPLWWSWGDRWGHTRIGVPLYFERAYQDRLLRIALPLYARWDTPERKLRVFLPFKTDYQAGDSRSTFYGLNLYGRTVDPSHDIDRHHVLWPLAHWGHEGKATSGHVFPLAWWADEHNRAKDPDRLRVLFPLWWEFHRQDVDRFHLWPLVSVKKQKAPEGNGSLRVGVLSDLFRYTTRPDGWRIDAPWPLASAKSGPQGWSARITPLVSLERGPLASRTVLLPLLWHQRRGMLAKDMWCTGIVPPLLSWWTRKGYDRDIWGVLGLYREKRSLGHVDLRVLWKLAEYKRDFDRYDFRILHRLVRVAREEHYRTWEIAPLWAWEHDTAEDYESWSVLRFLVSYERYKGRRELRFLHFLRIGLGEAPVHVEHVPGGAYEQGQGDRPEERQPEQDRHEEGQ